jgi:hypothetical protein
MEQRIMRYVLKSIFYLGAAGALGLFAFAIFADLPAPQHEIVLPIEAK